MMEMRVAFALVATLSSCLVIATMPNKHKNDISSIINVFSGNYTRSFGQSVLPKDPGAIYSEVYKLEESLLWLVEYLQSFIHITYFDIPGFEGSVEMIRQGLANIERYIELLKPKHFRLLKRLCFAKRMFEIMVFAAEELNRYDNSGNTYQQLILLMLELNVNLFGLYDSQGFLNRLIREFPNKIISSWRNMWIWDDDFKDLAGVPIESRRLFENQRLQAEETIGDLWSQLSDDEF